MVTDDADREQVLRAKAAVKQLEAARLSQSCPRLRAGHNLLVVIWV
jgi:hypothetical protein